MDLQQLISIYQDPKVGVDQAALDRQMMMAAALRKMSMTPLDTQGRQIGGMGYKISPLEGIAKLVQGYQAGGMEQQTDQERLALNQRMMAAMQASLLRTKEPENGGRPAGVSADALTAGGFPQTAQQAPAQGQGGDLSMDDLMKMGIYSGIGGPAAAALYAKNREIPDAVKADILKGKNLQATGSLETQELTRKVNQPESIRGGVAWTPTGGFQGMPGTAPPGFMNVPDPANPGAWKAVPINLGTSAVTQSTGAEATGKLYGNLLRNPVDANGNPLPATTEAAAIGLPPLTQQVPPQVQAQRDDIRKTTLQTELKGETDPKNRAAIQTELNALGNGTATVPPSGGVYTSPPLGTEAAQQRFSKSWEGLTVQNREAGNTKSYLQNIVDAAEKGAITGPGADKRELIQGFLQLAGIKEAVNTNATTQTQLLNKYHDQIVTRLGQGGLGTDAARSMLDSAYPGNHMNLDAIREAAANLSGAQSMVQAKTRFLADDASKSDARSYQRKEVQFDQAADPRIFQWMEIKNPAAKSAFAQQLQAQDPTFHDRIKKLVSMGAL